MKPAFAESVQRILSFRNRRMSDESSLAERIRFATAPGGLISTLWWVLARLTGIETHHVFSVALVAGSTPKVTAPVEEFCSVRSPAEAARIDPLLRDQLEGHLAKGVRELVSDGRQIHFLSTDRAIITQLLISPGPRIVLDAPSGVELEIGRERAFLSYLYTPSDRRRSGAASRLLQCVCTELARQGYTSLVAHVRATNVPSLNAFRTGGWRYVGTIWTRPVGDWLASAGLARHGLGAGRATDATN